MRKTILTTLGAALIAVSTVQVAAAAAQHRHTGKAERPATSEQFRNANNSVAPSTQSGWSYSGYSAPAGR